MASVFEIKTMRYIQAPTKEFTDIALEGLRDRDPMIPYDFWADAYPGLSFMMTPDGDGWMAYGNEESLKALLYDLQKKRFE